jgi:hypothetical protein
MPKHQKAVRMTGIPGLDRTALVLFLGLLLIYLPGRAQDEEEEEFKGVGIHVRLRGAWAMFSGGDLEKGTSGRYDRIVGELSASGFELTEKVKKSFSSGYEMGGDIAYYITPSVGVGFGGSFVGGHMESSVLFHWPGDLLDYRMTSLPELKVYSLRLGLFLSLPLNRLLTVCASAGPAWHFVEFRYTGDLIVSGGYENALHQEGKASHWGVQGALGLEIRMNRRLAFIIEAQGRYAKISGFEGKERTYQWENFETRAVDEDGTLYFIEGEDYPRLDIIQGQPAGDLQARKAVFNFSGLSLAAGLNFKF